MQHKCKYVIGDLNYEETPVCGKPCRSMAKLNGNLVELIYSDWCAAHEVDVRHQHNFVQEQVEMSLNNPKGPTMNFDTVKLGKKSPKYDKRTLQFDWYMTRTLPLIPPHRNWVAKVKNLGVMGNDKAGDCTIACAGHMVQEWTADSGTQYIIPDQAIIDAYVAVTGSEGAAYNPATGANDNGCTILDVLNYWKKTGIGGRTIMGYAQLTPGYQNISESTYLFGNAYLGVNLPLSARDQINAGKPWRFAGNTTGNNAPGSWGGHACFTGDTKVSLMDGRELSFLELANDYADKKFWVYSCDDKGNVVPGLAHSPRKTGEKRQLINVALDNKEVIKCTLDHRFLMRDGIYKEAKDLHPGDSLMPLYRRLSASKDLIGYEQFLNPASKKWRFTHRMSAWKTRTWSRGVVHHKDFNKRNNSPDNLEIMTWDEHTALHAGLSEVNAKGLLEYAKSEAGRAKSRELMKALWADPEWCARSLQRISENGKKVTAKLVAEGRCGGQAINKEILSACGKRTGPINILKAHSPEAKEKSKNSLARRRAEDPEYRARMAEHTRRIQPLSLIGPMTDAQREARRMNALRLCYRRWGKDYATFEEFLESRNAVVAPNNHKVVSVEFGGMEDVYDLTVDDYHNFALSAGVFVHNCPIVSYDQTGVLLITWGMIQYADWKWLAAYCDEAYAVLSADWLNSHQLSPGGFNLAQLQADLAQL